jgi:hypothetical protein
MHRYRGAEPIRKRPHITLLPESPVAGTRKMNGRPGVPPVMRGRLIRGAAGQPDAIGGGGSDGNVQLSGFSLAPFLRKIKPPAQSALSPC